MVSRIDDYIKEVTKLFDVTSSEKKLARLEKTMCKEVYKIYSELTISKIGDETSRLSDISSLTENGEFLTSKKTSWHNFEILEQRFQNGTNLAKQKLSIHKHTILELKNFLEKR